MYLVELTTFKGNAIYGLQEILLDNFPRNFYIWSAIVNGACMQKIKIGHPAKFRAKNKYFVQILSPVRAVFCARFNFRCANFDSFSWRVCLSYGACRLRAGVQLKTLSSLFKVAPYNFLSARALISKISRWRKLSNSTPKSRTGSRSKMPTNMASKLLQNVCRLNRRPQLSLLDVEEKYTRHARVSTNEADFMCFVRSPRSSSGAKQDGILPHIFAVLGVVCGVDTKAKI